MKDALDNIWSAISLFIFIGVMYLLMDIDKIMDKIMGYFGI